MEEENGNTKRILIADDSQTHLVNLARILKSAGHVVMTALSGNQAKAMAVAEKPDVIFLDIIMEDGDGYQACRAIKRNPELNKTPVIMVSSKSNPVDEQWARRLGADHYILKPYTEEEILTQLAKI